MNPSSIYKNQIKSKMSASKSKKSTIHVKDIHKLTPIPTAIKLKTPEPLKSHQECSIFEYPILDIVNTNFNLKMKSFTKIAVCPYFVTNCKNRCQRNQCFKEQCQIIIQPHIDFNNYP